MCDFFADSPPGAGHEGDPGIQGAQGAQGADGPAAGTLVINAVDFLTGVDILAKGGDGARGGEGGDGSKGGEGGDSGTGFLCEDDKELPGAPGGKGGRGGPGGKGGNGGDGGIVTVAMHRSRVTVLT